MSARFLIIGQLPPPVHGSNIMTERLVDSLQNIGHQVIIVEKTFSRRQKEIGKFSIAKLSKIPIVASKLLRAIIMYKPDLCLFFISVGLTAFIVDALFLLLIRLLGIQYVLYLHGRGLRDLGSKSPWAVRLLVNWTLSGSLGGLVLGERLKEDVNQFIPHDRLFVLPNAIRDIESEKLELAHDIHGMEGHVRVSFLSNLRPLKGPIEFLKMAKKVIENYNDVRFILAGPCRSAAFDKHIKDFIRQERLTNLVDMRGGIYGAQKEKFFQETDIFVLPSHSEASPLVNLEAMQWGLPIISSGAGSIPEIVREGINGYIVDPKDIEQLADRVLRLVKDSELRKKMGKAGREIYEEFFTIQAYEKRLEEAVRFFCRKKRNSDTTLGFLN